jgi:hypothetical protein
MSMRSLTTTVTDTTEAVITQGGSVIVHSFGFADEGAASLHIWMKGKRTLVEEDMEANLDQARADRALNRAMQAESHRLKLEAFEATVAARKAKAS